MSDDYFQRLTTGQTAPADGARAARVGVWVVAISATLLPLSLWVALANAEEWWWCGGAGNPCAPGWVGMPAAILVLLSALALVVGGIMAIAGAVRGGAGAPSSRAARSGAYALPTHGSITIDGVVVRLMDVHGVSSVTLTLDRQRIDCQYASDVRIGPHAYTVMIDAESGVVTLYARGGASR